MTIGKIGTFDVHKDNWETYIDRLEQYFVANAVQNELRVATLITVIGNDAYDLMVNLCTPDKPASKKYDELLKLMKGHLNPKPSQLAERFKFRQRIQKPNENISSYAAELKKMSKHCGFKADSLAENLRDQFVCGLANDDIRQKLFTEEDTISFDRAYTIAVSMEAAELNAALVEDCTRGKSGNGDNIPTTPVYQGRAMRGRSAGQSGRSTRHSRSSPAGGGGPRSTSGARVEKKRSGVGDYYRANQNNGCNVCGGGHEAISCKFKAYVCRVCNREGHLKRMCPRLRGKTSVNNIYSKESVSTDIVDSDSDEVLHTMISEGIARGYVRPLSRVTYAPHLAPRAFRLLAASAHRGRVLLHLSDTDVRVLPRFTCKSDDIHLILCDRSSLSLYLADRLISCGARKLHLHYDCPPRHLRYKLRSWEKLNINVEVSSENLIGERVSTLIENIGRRGAVVLKPESYRPITLLPTTSKVFEFLLLRHLVSPLTPRQEQYGFRAGHSTTLQLTRVLHHLTTARNNSECTISVFLDMEKAFDRVWHQGLVYKVSTSDAPRRITRLIQSFLKDRRFHVMVEGALSQERPVAAGVPQGSCLSPILYSRYTDDIPVVDDVQIALYADDTAYFVSSPSARFAATKIQRTLDRLPEWLAAWRMSVNVGKTQAMQSRGMKKATKPAKPLRLFDQEIPWAPKVKYLGVTIDKNLRMSQHVKEIIHRSTIAMTKLRPILQSKIPLRAKIGVYKLYIRSRLTYAAPAWFALTGPASRKRLRCVQSKTLRTIVGAPRYVRNSTIQRDLRMDSLDDFVQRLAKRMFERADASPWPHLQNLAPLHARPPDGKPLPRDLLA